MNQDLKIAVAHAMQKHGGGFVSAYADCWFKADLSNRAKLEVAFPDLWIRYESFVKVSK